MSIIKKICIVLSAAVVAHFIWLLKRSGRTVPAIRRALLDQNDPDTPNNSQVALRDGIVWGCYVVTTRLPWLDSCMVRSLTAYLLLRFRRYPARLHLGVRHGEGEQEIEGHLWVSDFSGVVCDMVSDIESYQEIATDSVEQEIRSVL